nr:uncharacterized protein LOC129153212 isoform X2 [Nothobranchius furzeri]
MLRHYRVKHENEEEANTPRTNTESRKIALDQAVLNFIIKDCQPLSIVELEGFRGLIQALDPSYVLPTRKTVKEMMAKKHAEELERVKREVQQAVAHSLCLAKSPNARRMLLSAAIVQLRLFVSGFQGTATMMLIFLELAFVIEFVVGGPV